MLHLNATIMWCSSFLFSFGMFITLISCSESSSEDKNRIKIDENRFQFELPKASKEFDGAIMEAMLRMNDKLIYLAQCDTNDSRLMFSVSKYTSQQKASIDEAFAETIQTTPQLSANSRLMEYKKYDVKGKTLRYKISNHGELYTIMYYFMKDDYAANLYEIKASISKEGLTKARAFMEEVALSVKIM
ncbi:MAG: hypothetical protein ACK5CY_10495 [Bacteroidia bacterium]|jgi:hypothetical protein